MKKKSWIEYRWDEAGLGYKSCMDAAQDSAHITQNVKENMDCTIIVVSKRMVDFWFQNSFHTKIR